MREYPGQGRVNNGAGVPSRAVALPDPAQSAKPVRAPGMRRKRAAFRRFAGNADFPAGRVTPARPVSSCHRKPDKRSIPMARVNTFAHMDLIQPLIDYSMTVQAMGLEKSLCELVKIRASQINGCAVCLNMHTAEARKMGETEQRIFVLEGWRESPLYSARECAALEWTEELTLMGRNAAPDDVYARLSAHFSEEEQVKLTLLITAINSWNRINAGFRMKHAAGAQRVAA
jgi:AhpD family alkylhydroperoxidase